MVMSPFAFLVTVLPSGISPDWPVCLRATSDLFFHGHFARLFDVLDEVGFLALSVLGVGGFLGGLDVVRRRELEDVARAYLGASSGYADWHPCHDALPGGASAISLARQENR